MLFIPRSAWARPSLQPVVLPQRRVRVILHHSVTKDDDDSPLLWESIGEILDHQRRLSTMRPDLFAGRRPDVPYQMVGYLNSEHGLVVVEGCGLDRIGAHVAGKNTASWGLAMAGNFESAEPFDLDLLAQDLLDLRAMLEEIRRDDFKLSGRPEPPILPWEPHQKHSATLCPGKQLLEVLRRMGEL